jgi:hypothetical protein
MHKHQLRSQNKKIKKIPASTTDTSILRIFFLSEEKISMKRESIIEGVWVRTRHLRFENKLNILMQFPLIYF